MTASSTASRTDLFLGYLAERKSRVSAALRRILPSRASALPASLPGRRELLDLLLEFSLQGKMIRGGLVHLGHELALSSDPRGAPEPSRSAGLDEAAAAMELFQSGLLIHDDIMDRDELRRGSPTVHVRYAREAAALGSSVPAHAGESLAVCAGDLCYFEAFALLSRSLAGRCEASDILALCAEELSAVGLAQMADVRWGSTSEEPPEEAILGMYRYKTARYSFSLPLAAGALLGGDPSLADSLMEIGEGLGTVFQIRDDELGLYGSAERIGKPVGSDLREGKKTIYRARLLARASPEEKARLSAIYGRAEAGPEDVAYVRTLTEELGVRAEIAALAEDLSDHADFLIRGLPVLDEGARAVLEGLLEYVSGREL